jgi:hypothetical protein
MRGRTRVPEIIDFSSRLETRAIDNRGKEFKLKRDLKQNYNALTVSILSNIVRYHRFMLRGRCWKMAQLPVVAHPANLGYDLLALEGGRRRRG